MTNVTRLPGPIADMWDWQRLGLCRGRDSAQFFHPDGERGASRGRREAAAKNVCRACPVRAQCAAQALATREPYGVWGGFSEGERLRLLAVGWEDCAVRGQEKVDVSRLEAKLGLRPSPPPIQLRTIRTHPAPSVPSQRRRAGTDRARPAAR
ncbi:hypothetical protein GCM10009827_023100 [Dactylosporangium maewongense]|uniref:Transcriptional regulator WhiB n=1 Tax=Dactylosporangium maewongense TaxID=634393 RepID=A0ABN1ZZN1_9ACTN